MLGPLLYPFKCNVNLVFLSFTSFFFFFYAPHSDNLFVLSFNLEN